MAVAEKSEVSDAMKTIRQYVDRKRCWAAILPRLI
jgi:hypothetical protein